MEGRTTIEASCHCGSSTFEFSVPDSSLPLQATLCHCNISRRISGALFTSYIPVPSEGNEKPNLSTLTPYESSDKWTRHFCTTCGAQLYYESREDGHLEVATGMLAKSDGIIQFQGHMWIEDTVDGGASEWITTIGDRPAKRWLVEREKSPEVPLGWKSKIPPAHFVEGDEKLRARCHCGGVEFFITRPSPPDNPDNKPWWISQDGKRYTAGTCACNSCRLCSGFDLTEWAFVPLANIELPAGKPFQRWWGTVKEYKSSSDVPRAFCEKCGATVFWHGDVRPTLIDVAVGLLDAESGARAEEWLDWRTHRSSYTEDALNRELVSALESGLAEWGKARKAGEESQEKSEKVV